MLGRTALITRVSLIPPQTARNKPMSVRSDWIWMDGKFVPYDEANIHVLTHTLHYGLGVFEGIRAYQQDDGGGGVFRLKEHLMRLYDSAKMCRIDIPFELDVLHEACLETLRRNNLVEAYIRPLVWLGEGQMGLGARNNQVHVAVAVWPWGAYLGEEGMPKGSRLGHPLLPDTRSHRYCSEPRSSATTSTRSWPAMRPTTTASTKPSCLTPLDSLPRAPARTSS